MLSLENLVNEIRDSNSRNEEVIGRHLSEIKEVLQSSSSLADKTLAIRKLGYLTLHGYDCSWASFPILQGIPVAKSVHRKSVYLVANLALDPHGTASMMAMNTFQKELAGKKPFEVGLALNCLANLLTFEMSLVLFPSVVPLLTSAKPMIRKKAAICLNRFITVNPDLADDIRPRLKELLKDEDQGTLTAAVNVILEQVRKNPTEMMDFIPVLFHLLKNTNNNWSTIKILKMLQVFIPREPRLIQKVIDTLGVLLQSTDAKSIQFEALRTVLRAMTVCNPPKLEALFKDAILTLHGYCLSHDVNLQYLALELLLSFLESLEPEAFENVKALIEGSAPQLASVILELCAASDLGIRKSSMGLAAYLTQPGEFLSYLKRWLSESSPQLFVDLLNVSSAKDFKMVTDLPEYTNVLIQACRHPGASQELIAQHLRGMSDHESTREILTQLADDTLFGNPDSQFDLNYPELHPALQELVVFLMGQLAMDSPLNPLRIRKLVTHKVVFGPYGGVALISLLKCLSKIPDKQEVVQLLAEVQPLYAGMCEETRHLCEEAAILSPFFLNLQNCGDLSELFLRTPKPDCFDATEPFFDLTQVE